MDLKELVIKGIYYDGIYDKELNTVYLTNRQTDFSFYYDKLTFDYKAKNWSNSKRVAFVYKGRDEKGKKLPHDQRRTYKNILKIGSYNENPHRCDGIVLEHAYDYITGVAADIDRVLTREDIDFCKSTKFLTIVNTSHDSSARPHIFVLFSERKRLMRSELNELRRKFNFLMDGDKMYKNQTIKNPLCPINNIIVRATEYISYEDFNQWVEDQLCKKWGGDYRESYKNWLLYKSPKDILVEKKRYIIDSVKQKERNKAWREKNRDYFKKWRAEHKEYVKQKNKEWRLAHPTVKKERPKLSDEEKRERYNAYKRRYIQSEKWKEYSREYHKRWRAKNELEKERSLGIIDIVDYDEKGKVVCGCRNVYMFYMLDNAYKRFNRLSNSPFMTVEEIYEEARTLQNNLAVPLPWEEVESMIARIVDYYSHRLDSYRFIKPLKDDGLIILSKGRKSLIHAYAAYVKTKKELTKIENIYIIIKNNKLDYILEQHKKFSNDLYNIILSDLISKSDFKKLSLNVLKNKVSILRKIKFEGKINNLSESEYFSVRLNKINKFEKELEAIFSFGYFKKGESRDKLGIDENGKLFIDSKIGFNRGFDIINKIMESLDYNIYKFEEYMLFRFYNLGLEDAVMYWEWFLQRYFYLVNQQDYYLRDRKYSKMKKMIYLMAMNYRIYKRQNDGSYRRFYPYGKNVNLNDKFLKRA